MLFEEFRLAHPTTWILAIFLAFVNALTIIVVIIKTNNNNE
jgi:hypothetical protein